MRVTSCVLMLSLAGALVGPTAKAITINNKRRVAAQKDDTHNQRLDSAILREKQIKIDAVAENQRIESENTNKEKAGIARAETAVVALSKWKADQKLEELVRLRGGRSFEVADKTNHHPWGGDGDYTPEIFRINIGLLGNALEIISEVPHETHSDGRFGPNFDYRNEYGVPEAWWVARIFPYLDGTRVDERVNKWIDTGY